MEKRGKNFYEVLKESSIYSWSTPSSNLMVFISHKSEDKEFAIKVGNYLQELGIDIYLDLNDENLNKATRERNAKGVVSAINKGLNACTHILCLVSKNTVDSWWVPYEIGFAKRANKKLVSLVNKDVSNLPEYLEIEKIIRSIPNLKDYIFEAYFASKLETRRILNESTTGLNSYLNVL